MDGQKDAPDGSISSARSNDSSDFFGIVHMPQFRSKRGADVDEEGGALGTGVVVVLVDVVKGGEVPL